ncbi:5-dehydro-4-deoxy-D-glucuronate isomerase [Coraliomargarita akajimensis]|uniref:4-deoxy-L-threo-5-hexosulose-uronate ketol-isomerase n=1 Tax=Coraliomargarita akajimensis (strain DSM 45221 / IAM 15411 / JCM 23193 / KCTC 12865 / 04OKA010-24) TaxID=583355 RepID=D5EQ72_CORAD|nr:5-dehydro-4-deoxy-D-glucuronate isomerase [Coraliomargarita akajimensis]ADE53840.1 4-deoxy-L-threo-5-hexosulose-uronateketol-isomer ase [Coraliomargarita akajimensis DSM 45221]
MESRYATGINEYKSMNTAQLRDAFLIDQLFKEDEVHLQYCETDRTIVGSAVPTSTELALEAGSALAAEYFCERRELGILNLGASGTVQVDGETYTLDTLDCLYVGRGSRDIRFISASADQPAQFYLASYPAHTSYPTTLTKRSAANPIQLGDTHNANKRTIYQYIHEGGVQSCQLVMGITALEDGSVWNTMPAHTHERRTEVYLYFNVDEDATVFHFMGTGDETRHITVHDKQAVISPAWSIHSGSGTRNYSFAWCMGGENQDFSDMQGIPIQALK